MSSRKLLCVAAFAFLAGGWTQGIATAQTTATQDSSQAAAKPATDKFIVGLSGIDDRNQLTGDPTKDQVPTLKMSDRLAIVLDGAIPEKFDASKAVLFLNGHKITDLKDSAWLPALHALVFRLSRDSDNAAAWNPVLGSPSFEPRTIAAGLSLDNLPASPLIARKDGTLPILKLALIPTGWLFAAIGAVLLVLAVVWAAASKTTILKDSLLPQLPPREQPFSLGRSQMAFWFTVIFAVYVFLFVLLWDYNTLTTQSLVLMGLSGATAIFAVAIDASKETPIGAANDKLRAIGLNTYDDVLRLRQQIADLQAELTAVPAPTPSRILVLQTQIADLQNKLRAWRDITRPFVSTGWYRDLTTDVNGPALHRLQMVVWTVTLGVVLLIEVYRNLSLPEFSATLLGVMGITSAGYLGFKYPEKQS
ncbi:MAG: hypothetical protein JWL84_3939 [Rhodospirillales bacterium]|nr:hypothetical protein [Rhodospirillales bacterium]